MSMRARTCQIRAPGSFSTTVHKKVPVLVHNGKPIAESVVIVEYIDEAWSDLYTLLPSNPYEKANTRFWAKFVEEKVP